MWGRVLKELWSKGLFRQFRTISHNGAIVTLRKKQLINLASNNYLGLSQDSRVMLAAQRAIARYGVGSTASRLILNLDIQSKLEEKIGQLKKKQACLVFSSGFSANVGLISSIVGEGDLILSDELNHASIIDGCRLSKADREIYSHCSIKDLESKLKKSKGKTTLVITDSIFSMDGDMAPLKDIIALKKKYKFLLMVDDAHATGVVDTYHRGIDICMGTLSKSLGSMGGYVCGSRELIDFLRNKARSFVYSTGLAPASVAGAMESLEILQKEDLGKDLLENSRYLKEKLVSYGFNVTGDYHILVLHLGSNREALQFQNELEKERVFVTAIRPPTVETPRLRITPMATHTRKELDTTARAIGRVGKKLNIIGGQRK